MFVWFKTLTQAQAKKLHSHRAVGGIFLFFRRPLPYLGLGVVWDSLPVGFFWVLWVLFLGCHLGQKLCGKKTLRLIIILTSSYYRPCRCSFVVRMRMGMVQVANCSDQKHLLLHLGGVVLLLQVIR